jgi:hypothetical protein
MQHLDWMPMQAYPCTRIDRPQRPNKKKQDPHLADRTGCTPEQGVA